MLSMTKRGRWKRRDAHEKQRNEENERERDKKEKYKKDQSKVDEMSPGRRKEEAINRMPSTDGHCGIIYILPLMGLVTYIESTIKRVHI